MIIIIFASCFVHSADIYKCCDIMCIVGNVQHKDLRVQRFLQRLGSLLLSLEEHQHMQYLHKQCNSKVCSGHIAREMIRIAMVLYKK